MDSLTEEIEARSEIKDRFMDLENDKLTVSRDVVFLTPVEVLTTEPHEESIIDFNQLNLPELMTSPFPYRATMKSEEDFSGYESTYGL